jgi:hypothetical protein
VEASTSSALSPVALGQHRIPADEITLLGLHREAETGLEHVILVGDVMAKCRKAFSMRQVHRVQPQSLSP